MTFRDRVYEQARRANRRVVLPEGGDPRVQAAARRITALGTGRAEALGVPAEDSRLPDCVAHLRHRRPDRFTSDTAARDALNQPLLFGACLVGIGAADAMVGGADAPTGDTIRAAVWAVGLAPGVTSVSGTFYMVREERTLSFTDCAVVPQPTPEQLAQSALAAATDRRRIVGDEPVVAFLSYSTKGSAAGPLVDHVRAGVELFRRLAPAVRCDGELQGDAALAADVANRKAPGSAVAGQANVLVFPDLDSGNIAYKLVQRLGGWEAVGPILQGLARPIADLSRGATVDDIVDTAAVAVLQAKE